MYTRTTYREGYCQGTPRRNTALTGGESPVANSADSLSLTTNRQLELSTGPLGPGYTVSTYRDAYCAPNFDPSSTLSIQGAGATRALSESPGTRHVPQLARSPDTDAAPKTSVFPPGRPRGTDHLPTRISGQFYSHTTYRDSWVNPYDAPGPILGVSSPIEVGARSITGTTCDIRSGTIGNLDYVHQRNATNEMRRSLGVARTTHRDAYGFPYPTEIPTGAPAAFEPPPPPIVRVTGETRAAALYPRKRGFRGSATADPRWPNRDTLRR
jgi:hypothetical protein